MVQEQLEVERKFDVGADTAVPPLEGVVPDTHPGPVFERQLVATYYDTTDLRLRAARITLRHRTGDHEAGWHLKLPVRAGRLEVRSTAPEPPAEVPEELRSRVRSLVRDRPLVPVARLVTTRTVHPLEDRAGRALVEVVDDLVVAQHLLQDRELSWREWEAELVAGEHQVLESVSAHLLAGGARPSASGSKVGRILDAGTSAGTAWWAAPAVVPQKGATAAQVVQAHLAQQVGELLARDPQVRQDEPDAVHKMRVATRRLRSALWTFRPLLDREQTDPLRDELRWLAATLGAARDAEVMHARLRALLDTQPPELVLGRVSDQVDTVLLGRYREAHGRAVQELDGSRCLALYEALDALASDPPWREVAHRSAADVLPGLVRRVDRRLTSAVRTAEQVTGEAHDEALHEARKLAKRLRYACESVAPVGGKQAVRLAAAATELQEVLGDHQDSVVTREALRQLGATGSRAGHNGFTFGRLHALEEARDEQRGEQWRAVWAQVSRRRLRRWLEG